MQVEVEHHWLPTLPRENDILLMDLFMSLNFTSVQLQQLNSCRLFLSALTVSDITAADGKYILPSYLNGNSPTDRSSILKWPRQPKPPVSSWTLWNNALAHISTNRKLHKRLGLWVDKPHQQWTWFLLCH
jgi:hypothetical protein